MDISNGYGIRVSLFVQGCEHYCKNCFNPETWDFDNGQEWTLEKENELLKLCRRDCIQGLSILGGEPLHPLNLSTVTNISKRFKENFPKKTLWIWTGYLLEEYIRNLEILNYVDVIVDGKYIEELKDITLKFRGSSNQRILRKGIDF